jgi:GT2 family glycosyltransferase
MEPPADFNEAAYLAAFPKVSEAIRAGTFKSALDHFLRKGGGESRLLEARYQKALAAHHSIHSISLQPQSAPPVSGQIASGLDVFLVGSGGFCAVIGWVDDRGQPLVELSLRTANGSRISSRQFARCRRADAEAAIGHPFNHLLGFWALLEVPLAVAAAADNQIVLQCGETELSYPASPKFIEATALRDTIFEYCASAAYFGSPVVETFLQLQTGIGHGLVRLNLNLSAQICAGAYVERYGPSNRKFAASIIVCLYGRSEYLFLQAAFFSVAAGARDYEFVFVSNSPELTEQLQREARIATNLYGMSITLVLLPGNAGFGAANNIAVAHAQSDRVLIVNPDVFPRDNFWAERHAQIVGSLPREQTMLFGVPLFYDDGSLMHGGMFFEIDSGLSIKQSGFTSQDLLRVEHYGKGAPPDMARYLTSDPVPAVTGAFMSADRGWFEKLGGFSQEYVFGHYEDADLCLKSWDAGQPVWRHDLPMWHLEGKGSVRRAAHEGGSMINRWYFTNSWLGLVQAEFSGPAPLRIRS